jgi:hypothetical protein
LELELRDGEWRHYVGGRFPFPASAVPSQNALGFNFKAVWKLYHEYLEQLMPDLLDALFPVSRSWTFGWPNLRDTLRGLRPRGASRHDEQEEAIHRSSST